MPSKSSRPISYTCSLRSEMSRLKQASFLRATSLLAAVDEKGWLAIFQLCDKNLKKVQSVRIPSMRNICFVHANKELLIVGERRYIYSFDLTSSSVTKIHITLPASTIYLSNDLKTFALLDTTKRHISLYCSSNKQKFHDVCMQSAVSSISFFQMTQKYSLLVLIAVFTRFGWKDASSLITFKPFSLGFHHAYRPHHWTTFLPSVLSQARCHSMMAWIQTTSHLSQTI